MICYKVIIDDSEITKKYFDEHGLDAVCARFCGKKVIHHCCVGYILDNDIPWIVELLGSRIGKIILCLGFDFNPENMSDDSLNKLSNLAVNMPILEEVRISSLRLDSRQKNWLGY